MLFLTAREWVKAGVLLGSVTLGVACGPGVQVPPPDVALAEYVDAIERSDAEKLRAMMTERARTEYSSREIASLLKRDAAEFRTRAQELSKLESAEAGEGEATVYLLRGRTASLELRGGRFWIRSAGLIPEMPHTPEQAVEFLRMAIQERDYALIERTLSSEARGNFSRAFEDLESSLSELDSAIVNVREAQATIEFLDGRVITLRREGSVWRVESFE
jgi:hypothetical protein